ncbi:TrmH family RNA methyltransferase [Planomonospora parontospora]|uniref:TrmH family RNA methyltransferase n=1 Tax=Planomonospora parontospora TaxID=58119 RepID=UPI00166F72BF|nr:RNA methyltransferase [Planomonospora parontospora]GGL30712.1 rRNA methyltransferase [Planomonospora parontospora subsp. antibiotica]GII16679.1 rRNA methyltransferase [Planomonospora parontospora subsp. antibiotica]
MHDAPDPRLTDFVHLRDVELRKSLEAEHGLFIAEGEKVIRRAVAAGYPVRSVLLTRRWVGSLADVLDGLGDRVHVVDDDVMEEITGFPVHRGALASMERRVLPSVAEVLAGPPRGGGRTAAAEPVRAEAAAGATARAEAAAGECRGGGARTAGERGVPGRVLVLEDLVDHGNVGAIFRCAAALGVEAVILSPRCADPLYRRSVKVSMGAVFAIPYARMADWYDGLAELRAAGFLTLALTPDQAAVPLDEVEMPERVALLLGSEGDGLSSRWLHEADQPVCIPMSPAAMGLGVDSLNVVAAAAIACHGLMRRDRPAG